MSANEPAPGLTACLTDREMEVLRLLVAGHTVKTIAARLGRSETSINERLRAARRKTGVGSSRELARLLDVQKTCDENIDLPRQRASVNDWTHTATVGVRGSIRNDCHAHRNTHGGRWTDVRSRSVYRSGWNTGRPL